MAVIQVDITELSDVLDVIEDRGIRCAVSYESDGAFLYGSDDLVEQVGDILWACEVMPFEADEAGDLAVSCQRFSTA